MFAFALAITVSAAQPAPRLTCVVDRDAVWINREQRALREANF